MTQPERKVKGFDLPVDLIEKFESTCTERHVQLKEGAEEALRNWVDGRRKSTAIEKPSITPESMKRIQNKYEGKHCSKCNKTIAVSGSCWWGKTDDGRSILICEECHNNAELNNQSDPVLLKKDLILQSYNQRIVEAKKLYNFLLNRINQAVAKEAAPDLNQLERDAQMAKGEAFRLITLYLKDKIGSPEEKQYVTRLAEEANKLDAVIQNIQQQRRQMNLNPKLTKSIKELLMEAEALPQPIPVKVGQKPTGQDQEISNPYDPNDPDRKAAGQIWCDQTEGGMWVFPEKCQICKERRPTTYQECQQKKAQH